MERLVPPFVTPQERSAVRYGAGRYEVTFDTDVSQCAYVATTTNAYSQALVAYTAGGHVGPQGVYVETKSQSGALTDGPFHVASPSGVYTGGYTDARTVYVETKNPGGGLQGGVPFHLAVICSDMPGANLAVVRSDGVAVRHFGPATARANTGRYQVATALMSSECVTVATRGSIDASVPYTPTTVEITPGGSPSAFGVELRDLLLFNGALRDEAFHVAIVCSGQ